MYSFTTAIPHPTVTDVNTCCITHALGDSMAVICLCAVYMTGSGLELLTALCMVKDCARSLLCNSHVSTFPRLSQPVEAGAPGPKG